MCLLDKILIMNYYGIYKLFKYVVRRYFNKTEEHTTRDYKIIIIKIR